MNGTLLGSQLWPYSLRNVKTVWPSASCAPRLVKICTTPFAASDPYSELAAAPLMTSIRSTSSVLMSASVSREMVPSTMMSGSAVPVRLVPARSRIAGAAPGCPDTVTTLAPATRPASAPTGEDDGASLICVASTTPTENAVFFCEVASPTPVTTTCSRFSTSLASSKSFSMRPAASVTAACLGV